VESFRDPRSGLVEAVHGFPANLQDALYGGSGLFIREVLLEAIVSDKADRRAGVVLDVLEIDAGSRCGIDGGLALLDVVPQATISDGMKLNQVYGPPEETLERFLEIEEIRKAAGHQRLEFHEHIDITALGIEVAAQDRSEYFQFAHAVKTAQSANFLEVVVDQWEHDLTQS
jgi:hypothetical protein